MTIQEKLQQLSEDDLREQVVIPLMGALGCAPVRSEQGPTEFGKDVVYCAKSIYGHSYHGAIVLKAERLHQGDVVATVQRQTQEAWTVQYMAPPDLATPVRMHEVTVMTSHTITPNARTTLQAAIGTYMPRVHFVDGDDLARLVRDVIKKAKQCASALSDYEFDAANFHEVCECVMQSSPEPRISDTPAISAVSTEPTEPSETV